MFFSRRWQHGLRAASLLAPWLGPSDQDSPGRFVLLSGPRSGTTWTLDLLNSHAQIVGFSEVFAHDHFGNMPHGGSQDVSTWDSYATLKLPSRGRLGRLRLYFEYLDQQVYSSRHGAPVVGFKLMHTQAQRGFAIPLYLKIRQVSVIHLIRWNHLDVLLSEEARKIRKYYHATAGSDVSPVRIRVEPETLEFRLQQRDDTVRQACDAFRRLGTPYREMAYEDLLRDKSRFGEMLEFLSVDPAQQLLSSPLQKLNSADHRELIENFEEVALALQGTRFVQLLRG